MATRKNPFLVKKDATASFSSPNISHDQANTIWQALRTAIAQIQNGNSSVLRFEELYRSSYNLVLHKHGDLLYGGVRDCIISKLLTIREIVRSQSNETLLATVVKQWEEHKLIMKMLRDILMYMDNDYCKKFKRVVVYHLGCQLFREHVLECADVNGRLRRLLLNNIDRERAGELMDRPLMRAALAMLMESNPKVVDEEKQLYLPAADYYQLVFENEMLTSTRTFYQQESQEFFAQNSVPDYLRKIELRIEEETSRAEQYLDRSTKDKLMKAVKDELIFKYARRIVEDDTTGCRALFRNDMFEDLSRLYGLFRDDETLVVILRDTLSNVVKELGVNIVQDKENAKNPTAFVQQVLDLRAKFQVFVVRCFAINRSLSRALKEALEYFINLDARAAQYLSLYLDELFRKNGAGMTTSEVDARLSQVLDIFRFLQDKDVFEEFYKQHLATRLLNNQSVNVELEKMMIGKLKTECGHQFTSRLEGMFRDMDLSKHITAEFAEAQRSMLAPGTVRSGAELGVSVLTTGFWPVASVPACTLPRAAAELSESFTSFYLARYSGRKLMWQPQLGNAELRVNFEKGRRELNVHSYQMVILMLYNQKDEYTYEELVRLTHIPETELKRHLLSLAHPKIRILRKEPNNIRIEKDHRFAFNEQYWSSLMRVKVPTMSGPAAAAAPSAAAAGGSSDAAAAAAAGDSKEDEVPESVLEARKTGVEAAVVRIMKARKELEHSLLIAEVIRQLSGRFVADPPFIKKRIESLIERDYLERHPENRNVYRYLA